MGTRYGYEDGWFIDPVTGRRSRTPPVASTWMGAPDDTGSGLSGWTDPTELRAAQKQALGQAGVTAGIGAAAELGQLGLSFIPTPQDTYNKERLGELEGAERANHLGLTGAERQQAEHTLMDPVRSMATEERASAEGHLAGMGGASAADLARVRRESERRVNEAALQAGTEIERQNLAAAEAQRQEMEQRRSYESERQRGRIDQVGQMVEGLAKLAGPVLAEQPAFTKISDAQLRAMQSAKAPDGSPLYPGLTGLSVDAMRTDYEALLRGKATAEQQGRWVMTAVPASQKEPTLRA